MEQIGQISKNKQITAWVVLGCMTGALGIITLKLIY